jgi:hypothetical protein
MEIRNSKIGVNALTLEVKRRLADGASLLAKCPRESVIAESLVLTRVTRIPPAAPNEWSERLVALAFSDTFPLTEGAFWACTGGAGVGAGGAGAAGAATRGVGLVGEPEPHPMDARATPRTGPTMRIINLMNLTLCAGWSPARDIELG